MCSGVGRKPSNAGHAIGTVNLSTVSTHLEAVGLNERLLSGVLTPQSCELTVYVNTCTHINSVIYAYVHIYMYIYMYMYIHVYICMYIHIHMHIYIHIVIHVSIYKYVYAYR